MLLHRAAEYFDQEAVYDGYTGQKLFYGQLASFDDNTSTGATLRRRALTIAPRHAIPSRRCVRIGAQRWIASLGVMESFQGQDIRNTFNLRVATDSYQVLTPGQVLVPPLAARAVYGYAEYFRDTTNAQTDNELDTFWNVFLAPQEPAAQGMFLKIGPRLKRVRQTHRSPEDLKLAQSDELDSDWSQTVVLSGNGTYDPVTDTESAETLVVPAIMVDPKTFYRWRIWAESQTQPGDKMLFINNTATIKVGSAVLLQNNNWRVVSFQPEMDVWALHVRRI
jgi:hypothetical protein